MKKIQGRMRVGALAFVCASVVLAGCQSVQPVPARVVDSLESIQAALIEGREDYEPVVTPRDPASLVPDIVAQALVPDLGVFNQERHHRFDLSVQQMPSTEFFMSLVQGTGNNMVVHPDVEGTISLDLKQVTIEEVMNVVRDAYGFDYRRTGNLYSVLPRGLRTEIFHLNYLAVQRIGKSTTQVSAGSTRSGSSDTNADTLAQGGTAAGAFPTNRGSASIETGSEADFWAELQTTLNAIVGEEKDGRQVITAPQTGLVVVKAMPAEIRAVKDYMERSQLILTRQVILEAKILEVSLSDSFQSGINWTSLIDLGKNKSGYLTQGGLGLNSGRALATQSPLVGVPGLTSGAEGGIFSATIDLPDFSAVVDLLETQGTVQVLSSPRVSTVNNQKAVIKVGEDEFFVTEVSSTTTTGTSTTTTPSVTLTPFFSGIALDVTPQISDEGEIILHVHPQISQVRDQTKTVSVGADNFTLPLAVSSIRESDSIVRAKSGQVVVIGGLMENTSIDNNAKTPGLAETPLFGHLFRQKAQESKKSELVILLRPTLTGGDTWRTTMTDSLQRFEDMDSVLRP